MKLNKILIIRTDRLGDCILSTPALEALKNINKNAEIDILTTPYTADVFTGNPYLHDIIIDDAAEYSIFSSQFRRLIYEISGRRYDACFILHLNARSALIPFLARIPVRVSPATKIYQIFSTIRILQKRSACEKNEAEYNLDLIKRAFEVDFKNTPARLFFKYTDKLFAENYINRMLNELKNSSIENLKKKGRKLIMVHPGCGGSALNMSPDNYAALISALQNAGFEILLSTGPAEENLKEYILAKLKIKPIYYKTEIFKNNEFSLKKTFAIISLCDAVIAPSTGILHAAAALARPVTALFCPIFVCTPRRWGPYMPAAAEIITPGTISNIENNITHEKYCIKCAGSRCAHFNCMDKINNIEIIEKLKKLLYSKKESPGEK